MPPFGTAARLSRVKRAARNGPTCCDAQVRDRATFFVAMLQGLARGGTGIGGLEAKAMLQPLAVPLEALETSAKSYMTNPADEPFSLSNGTDTGAPACPRESASASTMLARGSSTSTPPGKPRKG